MLSTKLFHDPQPKSLDEGQGHVTSILVLLHPKNFDLHRISCFGNKGSHCESEGTSDYQGNFVEHQYVIYINFVVRGFTAKRHQRFVVGTIDVHYLEH